LFGSYVVLFILALFTQGFTHDLLLETGVFLVPVKPIIMAYKSSVTGREITEQFHTIKKMLEVLRQNC
jgi:hypothetical protein